MIFGPNTFIFCPNSFIFCTKSKTNIFNSTSHSFHDLDFYFKFNPIYYIFVPKFYFPSQTLKNYFKFHLSFSCMLVINFIFYPYYFVICFKSSFSILKTSIFCPLKFILVPKSRKKFIFHKMIFRPIFLFSIPNFHFLSKKSIFFQIPQVCYHRASRFWPHSFIFCPNNFIFFPIISFYVPIISCILTKFNHLSQNFIFHPKQPF